METSSLASFHKKRLTLWYLSEAVPKVSYATTTPHSVEKEIDLTLPLKNFF